VFHVVLPGIPFVLYLVLKWFLREVVNSKGKHLIWEEVFKIAYKDTQESAFTFRMIYSRIIFQNCSTLRYSVLICILSC